MERIDAAPGSRCALTFSRGYAHTAMNADIWNILHDGPIARITGTIPGDVQFAVSIG